ncbi:MAG: nicotinate-nucleotide adenylyltransferase [Armatimonadota bacterium]
MSAEAHEGECALGILGGTFDPIHYGHLVAAEEARHAFGLDSILFIPCGQPYHKPKAPVAGGEDRYEMARLATASNPFFDASRVEIDRPGPSYTVDTVAALRGARPECALRVILGADAVEELASWAEPEWLLQQCRIVVVSRPGTPWEDVDRALPPEYAEHVDRLEIPGLHISSTELRARAADGRPLRYLVPEAVAGYIRERGLYGIRDGGPDA